MVRLSDRVEYANFYFNSRHGKNFLVDAGLGVSRSVCDQGIELNEIDAIFITHMHSDHYLELGPLIHTAWVSGRVKPIPIYGPKRLKYYWRAFLGSMVDDIRVRIEDEGRIDLEKLTSFYSFEDGQSLSLSNINIHVMRNLHPLYGIVLHFVLSGEIIQLYCQEIQPTCQK